MDAEVKKVEQNGNEKVDEGKLRGLLAAERDRRARECQAAMQRLLAEYGCELRPFATILADGRVGANVAVVAVERGG